jgi:hypothetical protein
MGQDRTLGQKQKLLNNGFVFTSSKVFSINNLFFFFLPSSLDADAASKQI